MMNPRYRDITSGQIPEVKHSNGIIVKIISGKIEGSQGPVEDIVIEPEYIDVTIPERTDFRHPTKPGHTVFAYIFEGQGLFCNETDPFAYDVEGRNYFDFQRNPYLGEGTIVLFEDGDEVVISTEKQNLRFLLISGKPIGEPIAWYGPIVMNTNEELQIAFEEYKQGTFTKHQG
jgi:redox-sensitive bicupin YhaK (pirin superfamily)